MFINVQIFALSMLSKLSSYCSAPTDDIDSSIGVHHSFIHSFITKTHLSETKMLGLDGSPSPNGYNVITSQLTRSTEEPKCACFVRKICQEQECLFDTSNKVLKPKMSDWFPCVYVVLFTVWSYVVVNGLHRRPTIVASSSEDLSERIKRMVTSPFLNSERNHLIWMLLYWMLSEENYQ